MGFSPEIIEFYVENYYQIFNTSFLNFLLDAKFAHHLWCHKSSHMEWNKHLNPFSAKDVLIDFTLSNARRVYSSKGNPLALKGLKTISLNPFSAKDVLIDITLSNVRRFYSSKGNPLALKGLMSQHNFQQLVKSFMRGQKILDVFLTNCPHLWKQTSVFKSLVQSDHLSKSLYSSIVR